MSRVFWDTNLFIYLYEGVAPLSTQVAGLRSRMLGRGDQLLTSTLTLGEILTKPMQMGNTALLDYYRKLLPSVAALIPFDEAAALHYAGIRVDRSLRPPDSMQLACAAAAGVDLFVTNDARLKGKQIAGIQFIVPLDRVPI